MINGNEYAWEDIVVAIAGRPVTGITDIKYSNKRNIDLIYGAGANPHTHGRGKKEPSAEITIFQSEFEALQAGLPAGTDLTDVAPFPIAVNYAVAGQAGITDVIESCRVESWEKGIKTGDGQMTIALKLKPLRIKLNQ